MFKVGDIVKLKSGGPAMTVNKNDGSKATCIWFKDDRLKTAVFRKDTIEFLDQNTKIAAASEKTNDEKLKVANTKSTRPKKIASKI